ncbi:MAG: DUF2304 family protein [Candidatus Gracilibacteria bacterium]|nr:DUF2304 family protein [Candidatus Gracilibacteria bacterium]
MNLLQIFFIVSALVIFIFAFDIAKRQKFNALHFIVFLLIGVALFIFTFFPNILNIFGGFFGLQRGADLLVYTSIIFLLYFTLLLLSKVERNREDITMLIREMAIQNSSRKSIGNEICFLVRVYNEDKVLSDTINKILERSDLDLLVVNDGSTDNSRKILESYNDKIILLNHSKNRGGGRALETGFEYIRRYSENKYIVTFDSDGQHDMADLNSFLDVLKNNKKVDVVLGSRFITKTNTNVGLLRKIVLKLGILFTFFISNIKLTDAHNGYRVFRREIINQLRLTIDDMGYASELIDIIRDKKIKFMEVPVNIKYTDYSMSKGQKSSNAINIALRIIWSKFFK